MESSGAAEAGGGGSVRRRLREFRLALSRYEHLSGVRVDKGLSLKVEEAELVVEEALLPAAREAVSQGLDFKGYVERIEAAGSLERLASEAASILGYRGETLDYRTALARLAEGAEVGEEERLAFILIQGAARAYARAYEEAYGRAEALTAECPLCGGSSDVMVKREDGYYMVCPFCFYEWRTGAEVACPYCGSTDRLAIGMFMDRARRVALAHCQDCGSSWKVVLDPSIRAPRVLLPLIALAAEKYKALIPNEED